MELISTSSEMMSANVTHSEIRNHYFFSFPGAPRLARNQHLICFPEPCKPRVFPAFASRGGCGFHHCWLQENKEAGRCTGPRGTCAVAAGWLEARPGSQRPAPAAPGRGGVRRIRELRGDKQRASFPRGWARGVQPDTRATPYTCESLPPLLAAVLPGLGSWNTRLAHARQRQVNS